MKKKIEYEDKALSIIHAKANTTKHECFFVGFVEGVLANRRVDATELGPLLAECAAIYRLVGDEDAREIIEEAGAGHADTADELLDLLSLIAEERLKTIDAQCSRSAANRFLGFCAGVNCDAEVTLNEARALLGRLEEKNDLSGDPRVNVLKHELLDVLEDGYLSSEEARRIGDLITCLVGDSYADTGIPSSETLPVVHDLDDVSVEELKGKCVIVTGAFAFGTRSEVSARLEEAGAIVVSAPSRKVDLAIIGTKGSPHYAFSHHGGKLAKLLKYRSEGPVPRIYIEAQFRDLFS